MFNYVIELRPRTPLKSYPQVVTVRTTAFEAAATTGGSASEEAAPAGEASTAGTSEFVGQVCRPFFSKCLVLFLTPLHNVHFVKYDGPVVKMALYMLQSHIM